MTKVESFHQVYVNIYFTYIVLHKFFISPSHHAEFVAEDMDTGGDVDPSEAKVRTLCVKCAFKLKPTSLCSYHLCVG